LGFCGFRFRAKFGDEGCWFVASVDLLVVSDKEVASGRWETLGGMRGGRM